MREEKERAFFHRFEPLIWAATTAAISLVFLYQAFATKEYVDSKHESVVSTLIEIRASLERIDQRTYEMARDKK